RAHGDGAARVVEVALVARLTVELVRPVAVRDGGGVEGVGGCVDGGEEARQVGRPGFDQHELAVGADSGGHVEVEGDLLAPAHVARGQRAGGARLVDLPEATAGRRARGKAELRAVLGQVGGGVGVVVGVDDGDGPAV